jgi:hypothetical protein
MLKYATTTASVGYGDGLIRLYAGDAWWADDPFVRAHPGFFADLPPKVHSTTGRVEQATAAPGEKRNVKR